MAPLIATALVAASCSGGGTSSDSTPKPADGGGNASDSFAANMPPCPVDALATATGPVNITIWQTLNAKSKEGFEALIAQYNASQDKVVVSNQSQGSAYKEIWDKYQSAAAAKDLPNLAILEDVNFQAVAESGTVLPAQACINADGTDTSTWMPSAMSYYSIDGALVPASANVSSPIIYYNKNHFRAAGLDPEVAPKTLAQIRDTAQKLKDAGVAKQPMVLYLHPWFFDNWITGAGDAVVNNDNGHGDGTTDQSTFDNASSLELFTWIKAMNDDGLLQALPYDGKTIDHFLAMQSQSGSMTIESSFAAVSIQSFLSGDSIKVGDGEVDVTNTAALDIGAGSFPGLDAAGKVMIGGSALFMTASGSPEQQAAAWDFMKWWNSPAIQAQWNITGSYIPFNQAAITEPALVDYWKNDLAGTWLQISYDQLAAVSPDNPGPVMGPFEKYRDALRDESASLVLRNAAPADAVATVVDKTNKALADYNAGGF